MPPKSTRARKAPNREPVSLAITTAPIPPSSLDQLQLAMQSIDPRLLEHDATIPVASVNTDNTIKPLSRHSTPSSEYSIPNDLQEPIRTEQGGNGKERAFSWSFAMEEAMFNELLHQVEMGKHADSGFKKEAWTAVCIQVAQHTTQEITLDRCKNKADMMKGY